MDINRLRKLSGLNEKRPGDRGFTPGVQEPEMDMPPRQVPSPPLQPMVPPSMPDEPPVIYQPTPDKDEEEPPRAPRSFRDYLRMIRRS